MFSGGYSPGVNFRVCKLLDHSFDILAEFEDTSRYEILYEESIPVGEFHSNFTVTTLPSPGEYAFMFSEYLVDAYQHDVFNSFGTIVASYSPIGVHLSISADQYKEYTSQYFENGHYLDFLVYMD